ncbi:unnamed protein product [Rotaria sordida]|uniref:NAD(P)(+)--arginine ADP-ribosyltransferase n=1 Tax=Rotaria sordida TaxID=392033 RepID=A0A814F817_9BILA|nr:unnamed protein product [Rotaria sordida]CAF1450453.1 unnamed protein product [Rotaria sordida]CAF1527162.1 unnamed protein product [Rotaria sordida]CAF3546943.1 unnamed protein product [Rotaria sordida]CAF4081642.1 unnamed protein product [Rotaria sordida]
MGPYGNVVLHVASCHGHNEIIQVLFTNNALKSFKNMSYRVLSSGESEIDEIKKLFTKNSNLFCSREETQDYDYIEWSLIGDFLIQKRQEFREQIDLYKTYDNQHHLITKLLIEIIEYYLQEYLVQQEHFSRDVTEKLEFYFKQAIEEKSYLKYFIKAYTSTNNFHRVLNKHLALYILDYFDISSYSSSPTKYRLINCLVHIVTLLIHHPDIHKYKYKGTTYRGLLMTENDLKHYSIGNHILNRSFVSTSKNRSVAQMFTGNGQETLANISVLLKYTTNQNQTAIDIEHLSTIKDEKEVLILPFSVFQVKDRIEHNPKMSPPVLVEIELEECENDQLINNKKQKGTCPLIVNRSVWNATKPKNNYTLLITPVPHVAIHHTTGPQCTTLHSCIIEVQRWQKFHMNIKEWDDIGYNFLVGGNGYIFEGRGWNHTGAHCKGFNPTSIGIGIIGDLTSVRP